MVTNMLMNCLECGKEIEKTVHNKKYCDDCKKKLAQQKVTDYFGKNRKIVIGECNANLQSIFAKNNPIYYTTVGFNEVSKFSALQTSKLLKMNWKDILSFYNKTDSLLEYVKNEFKSYVDKYRDSSVSNFNKSHKYITQEVTKILGCNNIKKECGFSRKGASLAILRENFDNVTLMLNRIPNWSEFEKNSSIHPTQYVRYFCTDETGWESVLKKLLSKKDFNLYLIEQEKTRSENAKIANSVMREKLGGLIALEEMESEFKRVFDTCFDKYNYYPTRRIFNILSKYTDALYRKRFKESWNETITRYGYPTKKFNRNEVYLLGLISELTGENYEPQKTFDWLIGVKGKKLYCDGYFNNLNLIVEYDGAQHRKPLVNFGGQERYERQVENDQVKDKLLKENGFILIRIPSNQKWYDRDYLINKLNKNGIPIKTLNTQTS